MRQAFIARFKALETGQGESAPCQQETHQRTCSKSCSGYAPWFVVRITVGRTRSFLGLVSGFLCSAHRGITGRMQALIQTLAELPDFRNAVQIFAGKHATKIGYQLFEFLLCVGEGFGCRGHKQAFHSDKRR